MHYQIIVQRFKRFCKTPRVGATTLAHSAVVQESGTRNFGWTSASTLFKLIIILRGFKAFYYNNTHSGVDLFWARQFMTV